MEYGKSHPSILCHMLLLECGGWGCHSASMMGRILTTVAAALMLSSGLDAVELTFKTSTVTFEAPIEAAGQDVVFAFANETAETIFITDKASRWTMDATCNCLTC